MWSAARPNAATATIASCCRSVRRRLGGYTADLGWEPVPSVSIRTVGGRPAATHAAIKPPHPKLSSSECSASTMSASRANDVRQLAHR